MSNIIIFVILGGIGFTIIIFLLYIILKHLKKLFKKPKIHERPKNFKCIDGDIVKSKGELIIDNYLYENGIEHLYEKKLKINGEIIKTDWYLPKIDVYIEYWGYYGKVYEKRKQEKLQLYQKGKIKLISIEDIMFEDIYSNLRNELKIFIEINNNYNKFCPNCGIKLDKRF